MSYNLLQNFIELDYLRMRTQPPQRLDFPEVVDLLDGVKVVFHALDCHVLGSLDALRFQNFRKRSLAFFGDQSIF